MKTLLVPVVFVTAVLAIMTGCTGQASNESESFSADSVKAEIAAVYAQFENASDVATMASFYAPDAVLHAPDQGPIYGREQIQALMAAMIDSGFVMQPTPLEMDVHSASLVSEYGSITLLDADGAVILNTPYLSIWKKVDGTWLLHRDFVSGTVAN